LRRAKEAEARASEQAAAWDSSTTAEGRRREGGDGAAEELLREMPELRAVHSRSSVRKLLEDSAAAAGTETVSA